MLSLFTRGSRTSLAIKSDGSVVGWGSPTDGLSSTPVGLTNVISLAIGASNVMALKADNTVVVWGRNLGPVSPYVPAGLTNVVAVAAGYFANMLLRPDGTLWAWNWSPQPTLYLAQSNVVTSSSQSLSGGTSHSVALGMQGQVFAWGNNNYGQCDVPADLTNVVGIAAVMGYSLALKDDGNIVGWGKCLDLQSGTYVPIALPPEATNVIAVAAGGWYRVALRADGTVVCWGSTPVPTTLPEGLTNVVAIAAGLGHCVALVGDGPPVLKAAPSNIVHTGGKLSLSLPTQSGRVYRLEYANAFPESNWVGLPMEAGKGTLQALSDPGATNSIRFYRARRW